MAKHIQNFTIHDYKGIHELKLNDLNSINILTGDNNSGKTSVLEILSTVDNPQNLRTWALCSRVNNVRARSRLYFNGFYNIFPIDNDDKIIAYDYTDEKGILNTVALKAKIEETQISDREMYRLNGLIKTGSTKKEDEIIDTTCMHLHTYINNQKVNESMIYDFQTKISFYVDKKKSFVRTIYISSVDHASGSPYLDDILSDSELYEELLNILKEFDDNIINVSTLKSKENPLTSEYMILTKKHQKALPLNSYGDGMKKALHLLSAIVKSRDGILLLDEFETAIHTSAMDSVFSWLLRSSLKLNEQVFLTSHSKEAINKVLRSNSKLQSHINLYTLYDFEGQNFARMLHCEEAIHAQENLGMELR